MSVDEDDKVIVATEIANRLKSEPGALLPILHEIQSASGFISPQVVPVVAKILNLSRAEVHGVISFYHHFRTEPGGVKTILICRAESCQAMGYEMSCTHPREIMAEIARLTPTFAGVSYEKLDELGSIQWPCNDASPQGPEFMHVGEFVRGKGYFSPKPYIASDEKSNNEYPLLLTTGRILSQYNVGAQTRRTENQQFHEQHLSVA